MNRKLKSTIGLSLFLVVMALLFGCDANTWNVKETQNLSIYYKPGSYAEKNLSSAVKSYENSFSIAEKFLPNIKKTPKIKVYLYEDLKSKGYSKVKQREVHFRYGEVFRLTSVHEFMHIFLYELNPDVPLRFEEGLCRIQEGKRKKFKGKTYSILYYQLVKLSSPEQWNVEEVFQDYYNNDDEGNIAAAFVLYALRELGEERFWTFYQDLDKTNWKPLLGKYFGKNVASINAEFSKFVEKIPDPPEAFRHKYSPQTAHMHQ